MSVVLNKYCKMILNVLVILISIPKVFMHLLSKPRMSKSRQVMSASLLALSLVGIYKIALMIFPMYNIVITIWFVLGIIIAGIFLMASILGY